MAQSGLHLQKEDQSRHPHLTNAKDVHPQVRKVKENSQEECLQCRKNRPINLHTPQPPRELALPKEEAIVTSGINIRHQGRDQIGAPRGHLCLLKEELEN